MRFAWCLFLGLVPGCGLAQPEYVDPAFSSGPVDGLPTVCSLGATDPSAREVPLAHVVREPGAWVDKKIRVRGRVLMIAQLGYQLFADGLRLPIRAADGSESILLAPLALRPTESPACGETLLDVEGTLVIRTHDIALTVSSIRAIPDDRDRSEP